MKFNKFMSIITSVALSAAISCPVLADGTVEFKGGKIQVTGVCDSQTKGNVVTMIVLKNGYTADDYNSMTDFTTFLSMVAHIEQTVTDESGNYKINALLSDDYPNGSYTVIIDSNDFEAPVFKTVEYIDPNEIKNIFININGEDNLENITQIILNNKDTLGLYTEDYEKLSPEMVLKINKAIKLDYDTEDVSGSIKRLCLAFFNETALCVINSAKDKETLLNVFKNYSDYIEINTSVFDTLSDKGKDSLLNLIVSENYLSLEEFSKEFYNKSILSVVNNELVGAIKDIVEKNPSLIGIDVDSDAYKNADKIKLYNYVEENKPYDSFEGLKEVIEKAIKAQQKDEEASDDKDKKPSGGSSGGGGGKDYVVNNNPAPTKPDNNQIIPDKANKFKDIKNHWAEKYIDEMYKKDLIKGISEEIFSPDSYLTRAEAAVILSRVLNLKRCDKIPFSDVLKSQWYYDGVSALYDAKLISEDSKFRPDDNITRQEFAKMVMEAVKNKNGAYPDAKKVSFADYEEISDWAKSYINMAVNANIIVGVNTDKGLSFNPNKNTTRAEATVIIKRLLDVIK